LFAATMPPTRTPFFIPAAIAAAILRLPFHFRRCACFRRRQRFMIARRLPAIARLMRTIFIFFAPPHDAARHADAAAARRRRATITSRRAIAAPFSCLFH